MTRFIILLILLLMMLVSGTSIAESQPVDGGWQRSDEMQDTPHILPPEDTPAPAVASLETATDPDAPQWGWGYYALAGVCGLIALTVLLYGLRRGT